jgi:hypothetical protein
MVLPLTIFNGNGFKSLFANYEAFLRRGILTADETARTEHPQSGL